MMKLLMEIVNIDDAIDSHLNFSEPGSYVEI